MPYFIDTNVPVGYAVPYDKWHESSKKFLNDAAEEVYWSTLVRMEYSKTLDSIIDDVEVFLDEIEKILKCNERDFSNCFEFENFILAQTRHCRLDKFKKRRIIECFWTSNDFAEGISEEIYIRFLKFLEDMTNIYFQRDSDLRKILILHDCGLENYLKYHDYALELYNEGIHQPDCKIIVDAHDCGLVHDDLIFITNDKEMLETISKLNTSNLRIMEFKSCNN